MLYHWETSFRKALVQEVEILKVNYTSENSNKTVCIITLIFITSCLHRELANQHSENLGTVLKYVIYNELSNSRNPNNMALLGTIFQSNQERAAKVCKKVLMTKF